MRRKGGGPAKPEYVGRAPEGYDGPRCEHLFSVWDYSGGRRGLPARPDAI